MIAQSYTLNLLLMHANKHLSYLSKRYRLQQVPGTLALQVIDCDMCDEVRTVYSLPAENLFLSPWRWLSGCRLFRAIT